MVFIIVKSSLHTNVLLNTLFIFFHKNRYFTTKIVKTSVFLTTC